MDQPAAMFQAQQLPVIEHFPVLAVAPPMQPGRLISIRNNIIRDALGPQLSQSGFCISHFPKVICIRFFEESTCMGNLAPWMRILDRK
jgi:hypothetical protein